MELDDGALGKANLFDLVGRTLRFIPQGSRYRVENGPLQWVSEFGPEITGAELTLHQFAFPFSGERWNSFSVGTTGSIAFRAGESMETANSDESKDGGVSIGRFDLLSEAASDYQCPGPVRLLQASHVGSPLRERPGGRCRGQVGPYRALWQYPGFHLVSKPPTDFRPCCIAMA
jgi:hypothetical protein